MLISIVVPIYKRGEYTDITLKNIEQVTGACAFDFEFILVDDGNTEEYYQKHIKPFADKHSTSCKVIRHRINEGLRNSAIDGLYAVSGEYIQKWDNDFLIKVGWFEKAVDILESYFCQIVTPAHDMRNNHVNADSPVVDERLGVYLVEFIGGCYFLRADSIKDKVFVRLTQKDRDTWASGVNGLYISSNLHLVDFDVHLFGETTELWAEHIANPQYTHEMFIKDEHREYYEETGRIVSMLQYKEDTDA